jgi:hypothetical protein
VRGCVATHGFELFSTHRNQQTQNVQMATRRREMQTVPFPARHHDANTQYSVPHQGRDQRAVITQ